MPPVAHSLDSAVAAEFRNNAHRTVYTTFVLPFIRFLRRDTTF